MLLLPIADPLGVLGVAEVILVLSFSQPSPHEFPLSGLAALGFEAVARALSAPVIGKKKSLAVQALASASGRLHRFQTQKEPLSENAANRRKKIQPQQNSDRRRRKKSFQQTLRRKLNRRRSHSRPSVLHPFHFNGGKIRNPRQIQTGEFQNRTVWRASWLLAFEFGICFGFLLSSFGFQATG